MLPTLWEQFGDGLFLFQHDCTLVHKLDWSTQSPDPRPEHLWGGLPSCPLSVSDLTIACMIRNEHEHS